MPTFTPPTVTEGIETGDRLIGRYKLDRGQSVVLKNGHYTLTRFPWAGDLESLTLGTDYFVGGYSYTITSAVATALTADGFGSYIT